MLVYLVVIVLIIRYGGFLLIVYICSLYTGNNFLRQVSCQFFNLCHHHRSLRAYLFYKSPRKAGLCLKGTILSSVDSTFLLACQPESEEECGQERWQLQF
ncbi:hypothetical protein VNO77_24827 [Canavalia gladiata]|uniref:Uncharacterized protein n=1 Tax=Canavalia gladiata TaxID=3824 RepID=A0AAN9L7J3_CANGL